GTMKVSIIGGGGLGGSMAADALQAGRGARPLWLLHAHKEGGRRPAPPLVPRAPPPAPPRTTRRGISEIHAHTTRGVTAGLRRKPDESRLDLINRNVDLFLGILDQVKAAGLKENAYLVVVSNPVDVLTYLAVQRCGLPWQRVLGLGTLLDTVRFRSYL